MMQDNHQNEIVIVRRRRDPDGDGPKGSVWKIAYADFMTAMMAFFLVMWLINVTDQDTREIVATYFNPIKFAEATTDRKGLRDPDSSSSGTDSDEHSSAIPLRGTAGEEDDGPAEQERARYSEAALFQDPYAILAELAAQLQADQPPSAMIDVSPGESGEPGLTGGDAFRDPFDPVYWQVAPQMQIGRSDGDGTGGPAGIADAGAAFPELGPGDGVAGTQITTAMLPLSARPDASPGVATGSAAATDPEPEESLERAQEDEAVAEETKVEDTLVEEMIAATVDEAEAALEGDAESTLEGLPNLAAAGAEEMRRRIEAGIEGSAGRFSQIPAVEVTATPEGILISLTDSARFGMFAIGSAEPKPEVVGVLAAVAKILAEREGSIVIRGHTDARPFRSKDYDNWRLSSARAHMAYYMLVRGGFDEARIARVEGHADRHLKLPDDPEAAENRRIEILLQEVGA
jgi:chemotaxis protein MotB